MARCRAIIPLTPDNRCGRGFDETDAGLRRGRGVLPRRCKRGSDDYHGRINDPALDIDETSILVIRGAGPVGWPGSAEVVNMQPPDALLNNNPNVDADDAAGGLDGLPLNRRHPLHVLVHLGVPGADGDIAVMGSAQDPCAATGNYVNG